MLNKPLSSRGVMMVSSQLTMMMTVKARKVKARKATVKVKVKALLLCVPAGEGQLKNRENSVLMIK